MGKWWSKDASPEVKETEVVNVQGNGNTIFTEHLQHLENINLAVSVIAILLIVGIVIFILKKCISTVKKHMQSNMQRAMAKEHRLTVLRSGLSRDL